MLQCPKCGGHTRRSHPKSAWENWRTRITASSPYRCVKCGCRAWGRGADASVNTIDGSASLQLADAVFAAGPPGIDELDFSALDIPPTRQNDCEYY